MTLDREMLQKILEKDMALSHYGIKGQEWGNRRFQNEDGSLTPEGRKRYGLKSEYSEMSDQELRDAINRKRTQDQYMSLRTENVRKKQGERAGLIRAISDVTNKTVKLGTTGVDEYTKGQIKKNKDLLDDPQKKDVAKEYGKVLGDSLRLNKQLREVTDKTTGLSASQASNISKLSVKRELTRVSREARESMEELDEKDLRKAVDRMMLEKQYDELVNPPKPSRVERGREVLQTTGSVMGVVLTGLLIAKGIYELVGKKVLKNSDDSNFLIHYGVKGMKKGERRYQNEDGSLTPEGYRHYGIDPNSQRDAKLKDDLIRQRAQIKAREEKLKFQRRAEARDAKYARRQAVMDAKNEARLEMIRNHQRIKEEREIKKEKEIMNRERATKIVKIGAVSIAAAAALTIVGKRFLKNKSLFKKIPRKSISSMAKAGKQAVTSLVPIKL